MLNFFTESSSILSTTFQLSRQFIGIELLEENFNLIINRLKTC